MRPTWGQYTLDDRETIFNHIESADRETFDPAEFPEPGSLLSRLRLLQVTSSRQIEFVFCVFCMAPRCGLSNSMTSRCDCVCFRGSCSSYPFKAIPVRTAEEGL